MICGLVSLFSIENGTPGCSNDGYLSVVLGPVPGLDGGSSPQGQFVQFCENGSASSVGFAVSISANVVMWSVAVSNGCVT